MSGPPTHAGRPRPPHDRRAVDRHGAGARGPRLAPRWVEPRITALTLAALLFVGGLMGTTGLLLDGVIRDGVPRYVYAGTMALCMGMSVPLLVRQRSGRWQTFGLVLLGDLVYVVVGFCVRDAEHYATPLMLLFASFVAAWFLGPWEVGTNMVVTAVACGVVMWPTYPTMGAWFIQVSVSAGMLNLASLGVFLLRRRVQRLLAATQALSITDPLTGLRNRRYLVDEAPRVWRQARRDGTRVAAMVLDLDHFKRLNDAYGHAAGDAVLHAVAGTLSATVRAADVLARTGGEELVVVGMVSDSAEAHHLAERLRAAVAATRTEAGLGITASIGIALTRPADAEDAVEALWRLIDRADAAMYEAKRQGRDRVAVRLRRPPDDHPPALPPRPRTGRADDCPADHTTGRHGTSRASGEPAGRAPEQVPEQQPGADEGPPTRPETPASDVA